MSRSIEAIIHTSSWKTRPRGGPCAKLVVCKYEHHACTRSSHPIIKPTTSNTHIFTRRLHNRIFGIYEMKWQPSRPSVHIGTPSLAHDTMPISGSFRPSRLGVAVIPRSEAVQLRGERRYQSLSFLHGLISIINLMTASRLDIFREDTCDAEIVLIHRRLHRSRYVAPDHRYKQCRDDHYFCLDSETQGHRMAANVKPRHFRQATSSIQSSLIA